MSQAAPRHATVLVVEDEPILLMAVADQLTDEGFTVHEASNADEALRLLAAHPEISVLYTDINMPGSMDGLELAAHVRRRWPPILVIVTSAVSRLAEAGLPPGSTFLPKPVPTRALLAALDAGAAH